MERIAQDQITSRHMVKKSEGRRYVAARRPYWERARRRWKGDHHLHRGEVRWSLDTGAMEIYLHVRPRHNPDGIFKRLMAPPARPQRFQGTWLELEVLEGQGHYGVLLRLVRRGFLRGGLGMVQLAEFAFRLDYRPMEIRVRDLDQTQEQVIRDSRFGGALTAGLLIEALSQCRNLTVVLSGGPMWIPAIYHRGGVFRIGERCPEVWRSTSGKGGGPTSINN